MAAFKKEILTRFIGTDEGEVTEYLGVDSRSALDQNTSWVTVS
jgi:hypothetical protein